MNMWQCTVCNYVYEPQLGDPDNGIKAGTSFEDLPDEWICPICSAASDLFAPYVNEEEM